MAPSTYILYHHMYSICSIMVRYTIAVRGPPKYATSELTIEEQAVDIFHEEQLTEHFLCEINPMGQVPVLSSPNFPKPIADSLEITLWLAEVYPSLIPDLYKTQTTSFLDRLHSLNFFSLSFPGRQRVADAFKAAAERRLEGDISDRYRKALYYKIEVLERDKIAGLQPEVTAIMCESAQALMADLEAVLPMPDADNARNKSSAWLFGLEKPTALDAHLIVFINRMRDVGRHELIPVRLRNYADLAMDLPEWKKTMDGRLTMIPKPT